MLNTIENLQIRRANKMSSPHQCVMCLVDGEDNDMGQTFYDKWRLLGSSEKDWGFSILRSQGL